MKLTYHEGRNFGDMLNPMIFKHFLGDALDENEEVSLLVTYQNFSRVIKLKGYEVFLCKFDLSVLGSNEMGAKIKIFPNPVSEYLNIEIPESIDIESIAIFNGRGQLVEEYLTKFTRKHAIPIKNIKDHNLYIHLKGKDFEKAYKVVNLNYDH